MKKSTKISLVLLTSASFLSGCSATNPQQECEKDKKGNCINSNSQHVYSRTPFYPISTSHSQLPFGRSSTSSVPISKLTSVSRGGFGSIAHFSASS